MLIVIEGTDKAGKATQTQLLKEGLQRKGKRVATLSFPLYSTIIGEEIKAFLHGEKDYPLQVRHMLLSANRWEMKSEIEKLLQENDIVILNRYYQSNLIYGMASGLKPEWLKTLDEGLPKEDLVIVLNVPADVSIKRMSNKGDIFEMNDDILRNVSRLYQELAPKHGWVLVNGDGDRKTVHEQVMKAVEDRMK